MSSRQVRTVPRPIVAPASECPVVPGPVPSFSIVIPVYNGAVTVGGAVESALGQTVAPLEVIVVDDGSADDLGAALAPYEGRITLVRKPNGGTASAINAALRRASGDFMAVLDADDAYEPERIEALGELAAARPDLDLLATDGLLEVGGCVVGRYCVETPFVREDQRAAILDRCFVLIPAIRREALVAAGGFDEAFRIVYDWDCYLRLILGGAKAGLVDVPLYRYRLGTESLTGNRPATLRETVTMLESVVYPGLGAGERATLNGALARERPRALLAEAEAALRTGDRDARRRSLAVVLSREFGPRTRLKASIGTLVPRLAGRQLAARDATTGKSHLRRNDPR
jgi:glycosyltransferase involved in cell wall biosynthesis